MHRRASSLLVVVGLALAACGGGASDEGMSTTSPPSERSSTSSGSTVTSASPPTVPSPTGLRAGVAEARLFAVRRQLDLQLHVEGNAGVAITTIRLASPMFEAIEATPKQITIQAGQGPASMPLSYGAAVCGSPPPGPSTVEVTVGGSVEPLPLDQAATENLEQVNARECAVRRVTDSVEIGFGDQWEPAGERAVSGRLTLRTRRPDVTAELADLRGTIIYTIQADGEPPVLTVEGDAVEDSVEVRVEVSRCDVHALIESARKYVFSAYISVDGEPPQAIDFAATGPAQDAFDELLADCIE
jgi:hypothetical protein